MNKDRGFAGLILIAAAVYGIIWYYRRKNAFQGTTVQSIIGPVGVQSGTGQRIAQESEAAIGKSTAGLPGYPRKACASWVSSVLMDLGIIKTCFPSVKGLEGGVESAGGRLVASPGTPVSSFAGLQPGDIVFLSDNFGLKHAVTYAGSGEVIGNSSSLGKVEETPIGSFGYPSYEAYRF